MIKKIMLKFVCAYFILLCIFVVLSTLAYAVPNDIIRENVTASEKLLKSEGISRKLCGIFLYKYDTFTDAMMYDISLSAYDESPFEAAMTNPVSRSAVRDGVVQPYDEGLLLAEGRTDMLERHTYGRYWHGYLLPLRTLSIYFDLRDIRILNYLIMTILFAASCLAIWNHVGKTALIIYVLSMLFVNFPMIPGSLQFSGCFYVMFIGIIALLHYPALTKTASQCGISFFVIGAVTSYIDLLTVPVVTLGIPLALLLSRDKGSGAPGMRIVLTVSACWFLGYASLWASKWILAMAVTGYDMLGDAVDAASIRMSHELPAKAEMMVDRFADKFLLIIGVSIAAGGAWAIRYRRHIVKSDSAILLVASIPLLWYAVLHNHSVVHFWFTWRALMVTFFCFMTFAVATYRRSRRVKIED